MRGITEKRTLLAGAMAVTVSASDYDAGAEEFL